RPTRKDSLLCSASGAAASQAELRAAVAGLAGLFRGSRSQGRIAICSAKTHLSPRAGALPPLGFLSAVAVKVFTSAYQVAVVRCCGPATAPLKAPRSMRLVLDLLETNGSAAATAAIGRGAGWASPGRGAGHREPRSAPDGWRRDSAALDGRRGCASHRVRPG